MFSYTQDGRITKKKMRINRYGTVDLEASYGFDTEGRLSTLTYPNSGGTYTYSYNGMGQLGGMTDQNNQSQVGTVTYGPGGELKVFGSETREYNVLGQLTRVTIPQVSFMGQTWPGTDLEYRYSATANNGQIVSRKDYVSGEEITYQYDSLSRLTSAASSISANSQMFTYDGWGNRTGLNASTWSYDGATNRLLGAYGYDANGNMTGMPKGTGSMTMSYDVENRLLATYQGYSGLEQYAYGVDNRRVYKRNVYPNAEQFFFWSGGQVLGIYSPNLDENENMTGLTTVKKYTYFGSRRLGERPDRLGSDVYNGT